MKKIHLSMIVALALASFGAGGCASYRPLQIQPVTEKKAVIHPDFQTASYRADRDGNVYMILHSRTKDRAGGQPVEQYLIVRMFWLPVGGKTSLEPSALNSTYRYIVMTPGAEGMYEGAGLIRLYDKIGKKRMDARIVDGDLRLTEATEHFKDTIGRARIRGNFSANLAEADTMDGILEAQRDFFARSMPDGTVKFDNNGNRINEAATQPSATPAATAPAATEKK
jgi:hypothetical protein